MGLIFGVNFELNGVEMIFGIDLMGVEISFEEGGTGVEGADDNCC